MMSWKGDWNKPRTVFTGSYTFPDGTVFTGEAHYFEAQVMVHTNPDGFTKTSESPCEPHFQFTGTWEKKGAAGSPMMPPTPDAAKV